MVSKAAERSRRQIETGNFCEPIPTYLYSIDEMIVNVRESCFCGMVFTVGRLMRIEEIV